MRRETNRCQTTDKVKTARNVLPADGNRTYGRQRGAKSSTEYFNNNLLKKGAGGRIWSVHFGEPCCCQLESRPFSVGQGGLTGQRQTGLEGSTEEIYRGGT